MRLVHVVLSLNVGGQEQIILHLSRAMRARGHEVSVISLSPGGTLRPAFEAEGIRIDEVSRPERFDPFLVGRLARMIRRLRPDVVHTHNSLPLIYAGPAARLALVRRVVHTKHGDHVYGRGSRALVRAATLTLSAFVAVSEETAEVAREQEGAGRVLHVIPNGVPLERFAADARARAEARAELAIPGGATVIGTVGRFVTEKDYPFLVRAAAPLLGEGLRLVLVGDGPERAAIEGAIPAAARPYVVLPGRRSDVPRLLTAFDVFAMSSASEGLPLVVPEAMATSLPIVATRVGGLPGIVPPSVGILVDHGDEAGLRAALADLAGDAPRRAALGEAARRYAHERFSLTQMASAYEALYSATASASRR